MFCDGVATWVAIGCSLLSGVKMTLFFPGFPIQLGFRGVAFLLHQALIQRKQLGSSNGNKNPLKLCAEQSRLVNNYIVIICFRAVSSLRQLSCNENHRSLSRVIIQITCYDSSGFEAVS